MRLRHAHLEISGHQKQIETLKLENQYLCFLGHSMKLFSIPSLVYFIYLQTQLFSLHAQDLVAGVACHINIVDRFVNLYEFLGEEDKNILCEIYLFDMVIA